MIYEIYKVYQLWYTKYKVYKSTIFDIRKIKYIKYIIYISTKVKVRIKKNEIISKKKLNRKNYENSREKLEFHVVVWI